MAAKSFILVFILSHLIIPLYRDDFYPWTAMPMFSSAPKEIVRYKISSRNLSNIDISEIGINFLDISNNFPYLGIVSKDLIIDENLFKNENYISNLICNKLNANQFGEEISLEKNIISPIAQSRNRIDTSKKNIFSIKIIAGAQCEINNKTIQ